MDKSIGTHLSFIEFRCFIQTRCHRCIKSSTWPCSQSGLQICKRMGRSEELSEFERGTVIGCHLSKKSVREISSLLDIPRSTVSNIIAKWKRLGTTETQPRSGRPRKVTERGRRVLGRIVSKSHQRSVDSITAEFQTSSGINLSTRTVRRELHGMGSHDRAAVCKPHITKRNAKSPGLPRGVDVGEGVDAGSPEEEYVKLLDDMGLARTEKSTEELIQNKDKDLTELLDFVE